MSASALRDVPANASHPSRNAPLREPLAQQQLHLLLHHAVAEDHDVALHNLGKHRERVAMTKTPFNSLKVTTTHEKILKTLLDPAVQPKLDTVIQKKLLLQ